MLTALTTATVFSTTFLVTRCIASAVVPSIGLRRGHQHIAPTTGSAPNAASGPRHGRNP